MIQRPEQKRQVQHNLALQDPVTLNATRRNTAVAAAAIAPGHILHHRDNLKHYPSAAATVKALSFRVDDSDAVKCFYGKTTVE